MPCLDMPLSELRNYRGVNPKPTDFDHYWDAALLELHSVTPNLTITKADFSSPIVDCFDCWFTGVRGARIYAKHLRPKHYSGKLPALLQFHGYGGNCGDWQSKIGYAASGFAVFAMDVRGQSGKSTDPGNVIGNTQRGHIIRGLMDQDPQNLFYRHVFLDTAELARLVIGLDFIDPEQVYTQGGSQGGALALACAALEPRIKRVAAHFPFLSDYKRVWDMDLDIDCYIELREHFRFFDPRHEREEETFSKLGYIDVHHLAPRIQAQVLMFSGLMDNICPPSTHFAVYNNLMSSKNIVIYPDFGHEYLPDSDDMVYEFLTKGNG